MIDALGVTLVVLYSLVIEGVVTAVAKIDGLTWTEAWTVGAIHAWACLALLSAFAWLMWV